jgi:hypothetical protein
VALSVTIDGTDRISLLQYGSLSITRTAGAREGRCDFTLRGLTPYLTQTLVIADGATTYFSGTVYGVNFRETVPGNWYTDISGHDTGAAATSASAPFSLSDQSASAAYLRHMATMPPLNWWRLGEPSGTTATDAMGARNGTYQGSPTLGAAGAMTTDSDTAVTLNGSSQWVDVGAYQLAGLSEFTIAAWGKTSYSGASQKIYAERKADGTGAWVLFYLNTSGRPVFQYRDNAGTSDTITVSSGNYADGAWHHFAVTKFGTAIVIYVDGVSAKTGTLTANNTLSGTILAKIGKDAYDGHYFTGSLDEVMLWNMDIGSAAVRSVWNCRNIKQYVSLTFSSTYDGATPAETGTVTTFDSGLAPGQEIGVSSVNLGKWMYSYTIKEVTISWDTSAHIRYVVKYGDDPLTLAGAVGGA